MGPLEEDISMSSHPLTSEQEAEGKVRKLKRRFSELEKVSLHIVVSQSPQWFSQSNELTQKHKETSSEDLLSDEHNVQMREERGYVPFSCQFFFWNCGTPWGPLQFSLRRTYLMSFRFS